MAKKLHLYILTGVGFAGKSTLAKEISKLRTAKVISLDNIVQMSGLEGKDLSGNDFLSLWSKLDHQAGELLQKGNDVIVDACSATQKAERAIAKNG